MEPEAEKSKITVRTNRRNRNSRYRKLIINLICSFLFTFSLSLLGVDLETLSLRNKKKRKRAQILGIFFVVPNLLYARSNSTFSLAIVHPWLYCIWAKICLSMHMLMYDTMTTTTKTIEGHISTKMSLQQHSRSKKNKLPATATHTHTLTHKLSPVLGQRRQGMEFVYYFSFVILYAFYYINILLMTQ